MLFDTGRPGSGSKTVGLNQTTPMNYWNERKFLVTLYILFALPLIVFLAITQPIFHVPDEPSHFMRAFQISQGEFFATKRPNPINSATHMVGGEVDNNAIKLFLHLYDTLRTYGKVNNQIMSELKTIQWGHPIWMPTPNVSIYPPFLYLPSALGITLGRYAEFSIYHTLILSRLLTGLTSFLIAVIALHFVGRGRAIFFVFLMLPITISQFASTSQDALIFSMSALCASILTRIWTTPANKQGLIVLLSFFAGALSATVSLARPPYLVLSLFFFLFAVLNWKSKWKRYLFLTIFFFNVFLLIAWFIYLADLFFTPVNNSPKNFLLYLVLFPIIPCMIIAIGYWLGAKFPWIIPGLGLLIVFTVIIYAMNQKFHLPDRVLLPDQLLTITRDPWAWLTMVLYTLKLYYSFFWASFFLGTFALNETLVPAYPAVATVAVFLTTCCAIGNSDTEENMHVAYVYNVILLTVLLICFIAVFLALCILWPQDGTGIIKGIQGRYFAPLGFFLSLLYPVFKYEKYTFFHLSKNILLRPVLILFVSITLLVLPWAVLSEYY